jgi:GxxExxY protein
MATKKFIDALSYEIIGSAIYVHKEMGSGLLENVYQHCMEEELRYRKINFTSEMTVPVLFRERALDVKLRCDFFVEECIVLELKSVIEMNKICEAQLLTYMNLLKSPKGVLINFCCENIFYEGQKTFVNEHYSKLSK